MKTAIAILVILAIAFGVGYVVGRYVTKQDVIIKEVTVTKTKYIKVPVTMEQYKECYESPIHIQTTAVDNIIRVRAFDECKEATADIEVGTQTKDNMLYVVSSFAFGMILGVVLQIIL